MRSFQNRQNGAKYFFVAFLVAKHIKIYYDDIRKTRKCQTKKSRKVMRFEKPQ